ncbi:MAG: AarF/UbiB family protein [Betaproteobacteria bacterium]
MLESLHAFQDLPRLRQLVAILVRHGFGDLLRRSGVGGLLERAGELLGAGQDPALASLALPVRMRMALEAMGPAFVKLGQVMSTRADLLSPDWIAELERLQDAVAPSPAAEVLAEMSEALGRPPEQVFADFDPVPFASASIAQVYRARLADGTPVVLKVRRPGIRPRIEADLRILQSLARLVEREMPQSRRFQPEQMVLQFRKSISRELDLALEARNQDRFTRNFRGDPGIVIPRIHWEFTSPVMNVQDFIDGVPGNDLGLLERSGLDRRTLADRGANAVLKMILVDGFFHADPHPGNVLYLPGNRLGMLDFGMVGRLSEQRRDQVVDLLDALSRQDERGMMRVLLDWTEDAAVDESRLALDLGELAFNYEHLELGEIRIGQLLADISAILRDHSIVLPADLALLFKSLVTLEGLGCRLYPEFHLLDHLRPFIRQVVAARYEPRALARRLRYGLASALGAAAGLPSELARLVSDARRGRVRIEFDLKRLDRFGHQIDRSANRLTLGVVTAALIVGSSIVMTVRGGPEVFGLPLFGVIGFAAASLNAVWLVLSIWRSNRE